MNIEDNISDLIYSKDIAIGVTTRNRRDVFNRTYSKIRVFTPDAPIFVVDDASDSPVEYSDYRFRRNVGISRAKNKCIEMMMGTRASHFFLFDDDCYPNKKGWYKPYVDCRYKHAMYLYPGGSNKVIYKDDEIFSCNYPRGVMMYVHRDVINKIGGMDIQFGRWGFEHNDFSNRIFNAGFTPFRFIDVIKDKDSIISLDETNSVEGTVPKSVKKKANKKLFESNKNKWYHTDYKSPTNKIIGYYSKHIIPHKPNRKDILKFENSCNSRKIPYSVISDTLEDDDVTQVKPRLNPKFQRWIDFYKFLITSKENFNYVFLVNPYKLEVINKINWEDIQDNIVVSGFDDIVGNKRMSKKNKTNVSYFSKRQLLNPDIVGGRIDTILELLRRLIDKIPNSDDSDILVFNKVCYSYFKGKIINNSTILGGNNKYSWFKINNDE